MFNPSFSSASPTAPPVHAPLPDPFTHQDPFLPSAKRHRRGSVGRSENEGTANFLNDGRSIAWSAGISDHRRQQSAPLNGPIPTYMQAIPTSGSATSVNEVGRRRSISGMSSTERDGPPNITLSHPPSSQTEMSPPSSQRPYTSQLALDRSMDKVSTYTNGHNHSKGRPTMRPAGSISISSLLGRDDAPAKPQIQGSTPEYRHSFTDAKNSSIGHTNTHLPNAISSTIRLDHVQNRRPYTPDDVKYNLAVSSRRKQLQSTTSPMTVCANGRTSPGDRLSSSDPAKHLYSPTKSNASSQLNLTRKDRDEANHTEAPISLKPRNQPLKSPSPFGERERQAYTGHKRTDHGQDSSIHNNNRNGLGRNIHGKVENGLERVNSQSRALLNSLDGQRFEVQSLVTNQDNGTGYWIPPERANGNNVKVATKNEFYERNEPIQRDQAVHAVLEAESTGRENRDKKDRSEQGRSSTDGQIQTLSNDSSNFRRRSEAFWLSANSARDHQRSRNILADGVPRRLEELPHHKVLAGITSENNKKTGRASPLPQAVQGAQTQPAGPGGNPSIKNEFGRMFSGLGSGLSSAPPNNGIVTPRLSPLPQRPHDGVESAPPHSNVNIESLRLIRTGSYPGGKTRRVKEDGTFASDGGECGGDGRSSPLTALEQGLKRSKHTHSSHHHHRPPHSHHHHHHHKAANDGSQPTGMNNSATQHLISRLSAGSLSNAFDNPASHHHHYHHHHHHHHHSALLPHHHHFSDGQNYRSSEEALKVPNVTVLSQEIRDSVKEFPRYHLGSQLYRPALSVAPPAITPLNAKFGYRSRFKPIPLFEGKANCTFTIRVPRYYLTRDQRELICLDRNLYGTDIYSDDSDPVAAAIHCGWIRGEWPEDVDVSLLHFSSSIDSEHSHGNHLDAGIGDLDSMSTMKVSPQHGPVRPGPHHDLHVTLLILPPLQRYASSVRHGLKSRSWGSNHDGMSYEIQKLEWVDEGDSSRGEERTGAARRKRLRAAMSFMGLEERSQKNLVGAAA